LGAVISWSGGTPLGGFLAPEVRQPVVMLACGITQEKMDDAFRAEVQRAIEAGEEKAPTVVSKSLAREIQRA
jgi:hypothetical protein